ncbi:Protein of unknown function [Eubacterium ruminantium]|uniref:DUF1189 domain-containing protein n=1 Tax=Eubacterium ruminantium TaxID=42322 RepID=A0A1T4K0M5_9FIRM|nr:MULTISPECIES: DUF1189 family protein [Eubacterium]MCR5368317.1 DUF1189 domain-containing protein [Eubacterium sp.]SCW28663.1 Protein of unknown function [Eubacterium ruminantium]SDM11048.1 Protein of unknown function [Eubacterium ruminantium]SJZ35981.1 Protein of unknown function [Eubacterium ruminantium]
MKEDDIRRLEPDRSDDNDYDNEKISNSNNLIQMIYQAIAQPKGYRDFLDLSKRRFKRFIIIIVFMVALMLMGLNIIIFILNVGGFKNFFEKKMPEFVVKNDQIVSEGTFDIRMGEFRIYFDTTEDSVPISKLKDGYTYITIGKSKIRVMNQGTNGRYYSSFAWNVSEIFANGTNNNTFVQATPFVYIGLILAFIIRMGLVFLKYWILAFFYGFYAKGLNAVTGNIHTEQEITRICLVSQTLGILLVNLNHALNAPLPPLLVSFIGIFLTFRRISAYFSNYIGDKELNA